MAASDFIDFEREAASGINPYYSGRLDATSNIAADLYGGAVASVVDFGASIYNSLAPESMEVSTASMLARISDNALRVYEENPDAVHTASFIGGMFVPSTLALKGMNALRSGAKGFSMFSAERRAADLASLEEMARAGASRAGEFRALSNSLYARGLGNQVMDAAAMEFAIIASMNEHPFMEDYLEDPLKNFGISMAIGGVIGGGIGHIADRFSVNHVLGKAQQEAGQFLADKLLPMHSGLAATDLLQARQRNIETMGNMLHNTEEPLTGLTKEYVESVLLTEMAQQEETFQRVLKQLDNTLPKEDVQNIRNMLANDDRFQSIDKITAAKVKEIEVMKNHTAGTLADEFGDPFETVALPGGGQGIQSRVRVYIPEEGAFGSTADLHHFGRANTLKGVDMDTISKHSRIANARIRAADQDAGMHLRNGSAPSVDRMYAEAVTYVDKLNDNLVKLAAIAPDDLPMMNALIMRMRKDPDKWADVAVTVTKAEPSYTPQLMQRVFSKVGVKADHHEAMLKFTNPQAMNKYDLMRQLDGEALRMLEGWRQGTGVNKLRAAADASFGGFGAMGQERQAEVFKSIYNSAPAKELRAEFMKLADSEGNVYLWRGMTRDPKGHAALQSYTTDINKAKEFGTPKLFKVHVDDIVGGIKDIPSKDGIARNEIIVRAPTRPVETSLPVGVAGEEKPLSALASVTKDTQRMTREQLTEHAIDLKQQMIADMADKGMAHLEIAIRTNTPKDTVASWLLSGRSGSLIEYGSPWEYSSKEAIKKKLGSESVPLVMSTNARKASWGHYSGNLDVAAANRINDQVMSNWLLGSKTQAGTALWERLYSNGARKVLDVVRSQISSAANGFAGSRFFQSADSFTAHMKDLGRFATYMGKELQEVSNSIIKNMTQDIRPALSIVAGDVAARTELSTALHLNAKLTGYRLYKDRRFWVETVVDNLDGNGPITKLVPAKLQGKAFIVRDDNVDRILTKMGENGKEVYRMRNAENKILGKPDLPDIGYWVPAFDPRNKFIAYLHNRADSTTQLIVGNTDKELQAAIAAIRPAYEERIADGTVGIFTKADQAAINLIAGRDDPIFMKIANSDMLHGGSSAQAIIKTNADSIADLIGGLEHSVKSSVTRMAEMSLYDISDNLKRLSQINQQYHANQPLGKIKSMIFKAKDAAQDVRDTLFDLKSLPNYEGWQVANSGFEAAAGYTLRKFSEGWQAIKDMVRDPKNSQGLNYKEYTELLKKQKMLNPYEQFGQQAEEVWKLSSMTDHGNQAKRLVTLSNGYAATAALRFGDLAQPIVNAMSLPILMTAAIAEKQPASFMGAKMAGKINIAEAMYDGIRSMASPNFKHFDDMWKKRGYYDAVVSEATDILALPRELQPGIMTTLEKALEHKIIKNFAAKPADYTETMTRKVAMFTGANLAKKLYPDLGDAGVTIFARNFMDRVIGNYHASQRPIFFQGTMGTAMGLFQTYMLTFAQQMYKQLQLKDYKTLGKTMLAQATVFGTGSLPGFAPISDMIGEHFSDDHTDLQTGTIRALPDGMAKAMLYGLPSSMGPAFYTRGELAPRISTPADLTALPQVQMAGQVAQTVGNVASALGSDAGNAPRALMQALSLQSVVRPLARGAELATGYSITGQGSTVSTPEEVWTFQGVAARLLGTRPTDEALAREAHHLNRMYESTDRESRQKVVNKLRTSIRSGDIYPDDLEELALQYMDEGGTPTGWRSAVRTAIMTTDQPLTTFLEGKLKDDSSLNHMIDMLDE